jgi:phosphonate transport system ATP-binding protein
MQAGRVVFDGAPAGLTAARVREVYGADESEFEEQAAAAARRPAANQAAPVAANAA